MPRLDPHGGIPVASPGAAWTEEAPGRGLSERWAARTERPDTRLPFTWALGSCAGSPNLSGSSSLSGPCTARGRTPLQRSATCGRTVPSSVGPSPPRSDRPLLGRAAPLPSPRRTVRRRLPTAHTSPPPGPPSPPHAPHCHCRWNQASPCGVWICFLFNVHHSRLHNLEMWLVRQD